MRYVQNRTVIEWLLGAVVALMWASIACAEVPSFTVVNKMPKFTVVNKCDDPFAVANKTPFVPKAKLSAFKQKEVVTTRRPEGHTHTCTSCGDTWDHRQNKTHTCANCGGTPPVSYATDRRGNVTIQYLADPTPRPVTVRSKVAESSPTVAQVLQRMSVVSYQNCGPGGCLPPSRK